MINIKSIYIIILLSLIFGVLGFFIHPYFIQLSILEMKDVKVVSFDLAGSFNLRILMGIIFTFIPLFLFSVMKVLNVDGKKDKVFILLSILIAGIIFWQFKLYSIQERLKELQGQTEGSDVNYVFSQEDLNLEIYLFIGFFVGAMISGIALHQFRKKKL